MALTKHNKNIIATFENVVARCKQFLDASQLIDETELEDQALRLALELCKYGEYIKATLFLHHAATASTAQSRTRRELSPQEQAALQGASDEEKALVEQTPPPGSNI